MKKILAALSAAALAACAPIGPSMLGHRDEPNQASRTIVITPATKYVNVADGEVVTFRSNDTAFTWYIDGPQGLYSFQLNTIAPSGTLDHAVTVYVAPNPLYE
ncbi:CzcE family metal-binding protein [Variovorax saccharolyticus]|uniref:CzcE family metal-binding protein n=1 Tax=Variovorax saccharolyticus TaxID=3053516 RepID=UPI0025750F28|nr:CzcE family metal-binding protein [Variovorax sp. J22R187]MDM0020831.1 CzcE family metal-binding protein [Variovorax sp. J22R187]